MSCAELQVSSQAHLDLPVAPGARRDRRGGARRRQDRHDAEGHRPGVRRQGPPRRASAPVTCSTRRVRRPRSRPAPSPRTREIDRRRRRAARRRRDRRAVQRARRAAWPRTSPTRCSLLHDALGRRRPPAARGRPGDVPRPRPRHLSVRHVVEPDGRRRVRRHRARAARHRPHRRHHQGVHHPRRRRAVPDRAPRRRSATRSSTSAASSARSPAGGGAPAGSTA